MHWFFVAILFISLSFPAWPSQRPNFTGTWKIDADRSRIADVPAVKNTVLKIDQQDGKIIVTTTNGDRKPDTFELPTDGAEQKITIDNQPGTARASWDDERLVIAITRGTPAGPVTETRSAKLSDTGKTMSTIYTLKDNTGEKRGYGFYVKQP